jgi:hypothetical protein
MTDEEIGFLDLTHKSLTPFPVGPVTEGAHQGDDKGRRLWRKLGYS